MKKKEITVLFENTTLAVADPYCSNDRVTLDNCLSGKWHSNIMTENFGPFGERNSSLELKHENHNEKAGWTLAGEIGVDAGTAAIFDPELSDFGEIYGAQCSSGLGDGVYPVEISKNDKQQVTAIRVNFDIYND